VTRAFRSHHQSFWLARRACRDGALPGPRPLARRRYPLTAPERIPRMN
jgi:hypothetical protein